MKIMLGIAAIIFSVSIAYYLLFYLPQRDNEMMFIQQQALATPTPIDTPTPTIYQDPPGYRNGIPLEPPAQMMYELNNSY